jgi:hypothetical protein
MGGDTTSSTNTSTTAPANPQVTATVNQLLGGLSNAYNQGAPPVFNQSLYSPAGATTQSAWAQSAAAANNPLYSQGVNSSLGYANNLLGTGGLNQTQSGALNNLTGLGKQYSDLGGAYDTTSPAEQRLRSNLVDTTMQNVGALYNNSGRFGGGSFNQSLGKGLGDALAGFDTNIYDKNVANKYASLQGQQGVDTSAFGMGQQGVTNAFGAASSLPGLYGALQAPSATLGAIGAAQDANQQGILQGQYDLSQRQANNQTDWLAKLSSILAGNASTSGSTNTSTSSTPATPWWQSALGLGASLL